MSKKITLSADGNTATVADATLSDVFTTALSTDSALTGTYGFLQRLALVGGGMVIQQYRRFGNINPL